MSVWFLTAVPMRASCFEASDGSFRVKRRLRVDVSLGMTRFCYNPSRQLSLRQLYCASNPSTVLAVSPLMREA